MLYARTEIVRVLFIYAEYKIPFLRIILRGRRRRRVLSGAMIAARIGRFRIHHTGAGE